MLRDQKQNPDRSELVRRSVKEQLKCEDILRNQSGQGVNWDYYKPRPPVAALGCPTHLRKILGRPQECVKVFLEIN